MVVMLAVDVKCDDDFRVNAHASVSIKIGTYGEGQTIYAVVCLRAEIAAPAIVVYP